MFAIVSHYLKGHLAETAPTIRLQVEKLIALGASWDLTVRAVALRLLWAGTANSTPVAVWAAAFVYKDQELTQKLRDELAHADSRVPLDERLASAQRDESLIDVRVDRQASFKGHFGAHCRRRAFACPQGRYCPWPMPGNAPRIQSSRRIYFRQSKESARGW